jgi:hypothetical protein
LGAGAVLGIVLFIKTPDKTSIARTPPFPAVPFVSNRA